MMFTSKTVTQLPENITSFDAFSGVMYFYYKINEYKTKFE